jgi:hypothetical protein
MTFTVIRTFPPVRAVLFQGPPSRPIVNFLRILPLSPIPVCPSHIRLPQSFPHLLPLIITSSTIRFHHTKLLRSHSSSHITFCLHLIHQLPTGFPRSVIIIPLTFEHNDIHTHMHFRSTDSTVGSTFAVSHNPQLSHLSASILDSWLAFSC